MSKKEQVIPAANQEKIQNKIYTIRGVQVIIDKDLAMLYGVTTKRLNEQVKRNKKRFPEYYMFHLTKEEQDEVVANCDHLKSLKFSPNLHYAFTEHGVSQVASVINSNIAIEISIQIIDAFVTMRKFLVSQGDILYRLSNVEKKQLEYETKIDKVFNALEQKEETKQGIFFNGQIFDAHKFVSDLIRSAKQSIVLIDNYIDDRVLSLLTKRKKDVNALIITKEIKKQLQVDLDKHNTQYPEIKIKKFKHSHDRFLIIDKEHVYHIGASLKDLGVNWFAFSKMEKKSLKIIAEVNKL